MDETALRALIDDLRQGRLEPDDAVAQLRRLPFADLGFARVDHHRALRQGMAEAVYGPGKTPDQCVAIVAELLREDAASPVVLSRADDAQVEAVLDAHPTGRLSGGQPTTVVWRPAPPRRGRVLVVTAGTSDLPVADECAAVLHAHGIRPERLADVGVAGIHRLLAAADEIAAAHAIVAVAGMEGALASVLGGLAAGPVVAVPTSTGYGAGLEGVTALLAMLASCASGMTVVGIDNGFGAACAVVRMLDMAARLRLRSGGDPGVTRLARGSTASRASPATWPWASLVDAGADLDEVRAMCQQVPVSGWGLEAEAVMRNGIAATHINVLAEATTVVRTAAHITGLLHEARLPDRVRERSLAVFGALARAEGKLHNRPPEQVHFHEVGALDAIIDVVGTCAALELLDVDQVHASPVAHGIGMIRSAHGALPNPPPAVVESAARARPSTVSTSPSS